ncbi:MBL fold metallo-hydrolase [Novosphingobium sp. 9]|uniref:MBL fold metallo-hydrolase n=1 Tax=Novosphingobium sp. 9 TaxID=2025349 RepID=UPI0021B54825|nr:MBL fold metallo-hydrolase [Novosphingobium sp. 9]
MYNPAQTRQLTPHVWMMPGYPNAVIVVGKTGVLAVDTGLGTPNGRIVAAEAKRLAPGRKLYLVTTHFHPEHAAGFGGFPGDTVLIRPRVQQRELVLDHERMVARFAIDNPEVLKNPVFGTPELFDHERDIDLGGVHARAIYAGPAHTAGDTSVFIPEDSVLVTGDTIQNRFGPTFLGGGIGPAPWLATVKRLAVLKPKLIIPDHTQPGPGARIIADEEAILSEMVTRTAAAKKAGQTREQAIASVMKTIRAERPGWNIGPLADDGVARAYDAAK